MKDGSRIVDHRDCGMGFLKYEFKKNGRVNESTSVIFNEYETLYELKDSSLRIGGTMFKVLKITRDSLKLAEALVIDTSKIRVYDFVKVRTMALQTQSYFDPVLQDTVYKAGRLLFPQIRGKLADLMKIISGKFERARLNVSFVIDKSGKIKKAAVLNTDSVSAKFAQKVMNSLRSDDLAWEPACTRSLPVNCEVQMTLRCANIGGTNTMLASFPFIPKIPVKTLGYRDAQTANDYYNTAVGEMQIKNYQYAVDMLTDCLKIDDTDTDAYYLRAQCNYSLGKKAEACKDWATLAGLGQVKAAKNLEKFCKK